VVVEWEGLSQEQCIWVEGVTGAAWEHEWRSQGQILRVKGAHIGSVGWKGCRRGSAGGLKGLTWAVRMG